MISRQPQSDLQNQKSLSSVLLHNRFTAAVSSFDTTQQPLSTQRPSPGRTWKVFFLGVKARKRFVFWKQCTFYFLLPTRWSAGCAPSQTFQGVTKLNSTPAGFLRNWCGNGKTATVFLTDGGNVLCPGSWQRETSFFFFCRSQNQHILESPGRRPFVPKHKLWVQMWRRCMWNSQRSKSSDLLIIWPRCFCLWFLELKTNILYLKQTSIQQTY